MKVYDFIHKKIYERDEDGKMNELVWDVKAEKCWKKDKRSNGDSSKKPTSDQGKQ